VTAQRPSASSQPAANAAPPRTIAAFLRERLLDPELAALAWRVADGRVPLVVAGAAPARATATELADALAAFVPAGAGRAGLGMTEVEGDRDRDVLVAGLLSGGQLRRAVRGVARGFGLVVAVEAGSLESLVRRLADLAVGATPEMIGRLGVVLVLDERPPHRVVAAHYLRPVARDAAGHVQRLPPAVLATWDPAAERLDHFEWALYAELADRLGVRPGDLERSHLERTEILSTMVRAGGVDAGQVAATLAHARGHA
jgi:hypothetical protein